MKAQDEGLRPEGVKYLAKRVTEVLLAKQQKYLNEQQEKAIELRRALNVREVAYIKTLPKDELAEACVANMFGRGSEHYHKHVTPLIIKVKKKFKAEHREIEKLEGGCGRRSYRDDSLIPLFAKKKNEVLDELMLGDQKKALAVLATLEKWNP